MKCRDCKYYSYVDGTIFCDSRNHKRKTVRIGRDDAERDINCLWSDEYENEEERRLEEMFGGGKDKSEKE